MTEIYLKETKKDDAKYKCVFFDEIETDNRLGLIKNLASIEEINRPKLIDLSELVGNYQIKFECSNNNVDWFEGYLFKDYGLDNPYRFGIADIVNGKLRQTGVFNHIRLSTRQWYFNSDLKCPYPEGVLFECKHVAKTSNVIITSTNMIERYFCPDSMWSEHKKYRTKIIAHRPTGLLPGYVMPGDENDK